MGFYCLYMLKMALELAQDDLIYEDVASKFFEHFISIANAMNSAGSGTGLWDNDTGFYYDQLKNTQTGRDTPLRIRSMVGLVPFFAVANLPENIISNLEGFNRRTQWFIKNRPKEAAQITFAQQREHNEAAHILSIPNQDKIKAMLKYLLDEGEFLSDFGIRSMSKYHKDHPFVFNTDHNEKHEVSYVPGESNSGLFGGNSNWRGPIWFPMNFLLIESLGRIHNFYGDEMKVEYPTGSGKEVCLEDVAYDLNSRLVKLFLPDENGRRPCHGNDENFRKDPNYKDLIYFYEYFHGDSGAGLGASHQTGWTALVACCLDEIGRQREDKVGRGKHGRSHDHPGHKH
eukprot:TRINITY_DN15140_c0_g1_i4.p1 TRINITY_DN15140_c0_g1~~TRINITY_DN15140_c0_g1_i4.p1  ORF type:complete len:343 (-),score=125.52 TRINITY_DN15140_c0_g1_i4:189-1217(-)